MDGWVVFDFGLIYVEYRVFQLLPKGILHF